jgi:hypothetical protein
MSKASGLGTFLVRGTINREVSSHTEGMPGFSSHIITLIAKRVISAENGPLGMRQMIVS